MISHRRVFRWDAGPEVDIDAPTEIAKAMPPSVAMRVTDEQPGLMCLRGLFDTLQAMKKTDQSEEDIAAGSPELRDSDGTMDAPGEDKDKDTDTKP